MTSSLLVVFFSENLIFTDCAIIGQMLYFYSNQVLRNLDEWKVSITNFNQILTKLQNNQK